MTLRGPDRNYADLEAALAGGDRSCHWILTPNRRVTRDLKVLMADDDPAQLMLSGGGAGRCGLPGLHGRRRHGGRSSSSTRSAPDLVVLDVNMPRLSGIDACRELRRRAGGRDHRS